MVDTYHLNDTFALIKILANQDLLFFESCFFLFYFWLVIKYMHS